MSNEKSDISPFWLNEIFPDPKNIFSMSNKTLNEIKDDCFIVLDANVLLLPYQMQNVSLPDVISVYKPLCEKGNLVIPAQSAREFIKNRASKVAEVVTYLKNRSSEDFNLLKNKVGLLSDHPEYRKISEESSKLLVELKALQKRLRNVADEIAADVGRDPVSLAYKEIFKNSVCNDPAECSDEQKFKAELKKRYQCRRPPGFKDQGKEDTGAGDLIIWKTILEVGKTRNTNCIFVTGDEKTDWYAQANGPFQPRVELIEEYRINTDKSLHIIPLSRLLKLFKAKESVVENVESAEENHNPNFDIFIENATKDRHMTSDININSNNLTINHLRKMNDKIVKEGKLDFFDMFYLVSLKTDGSEADFMRILFPNLYDFFKRLKMPLANYNV